MGDSEKKRNARRGVSRHLNFAWVEYGHTGDGIAFDAGMRRRGHKNMLHRLSVQTLAGKRLRRDDDHPLLPIQRHGSALMVRPNDKSEFSGEMIRSPLFIDFRKKNGEEVFLEEIQKQNRFIAKWVMNPGVEANGAASRLVADESAQIYADLISISGHGSAGVVWGGGEKCFLDIGVALHQGAKTAFSEKLKYMLIPSCYNLNHANRKAWLPYFRRKPPMHGILGYCMSYPGGSPGAGMYRRFAENLHKNMTILEAFRLSHQHSKRVKKAWGAVIHSGALDFKMSDWLSDDPSRIPALDPDGDILFFDENRRDGEVISEAPPDFEAQFFVPPAAGAEPVLVTPLNTHDDNIGIIAGEKGKLRIVANDPGKPILKGDRFILVFMYYRPEKGSMQMNKLMKFDQPADAKLTLHKQINWYNANDAVDGFDLEVTGGALSKIDIPFTVVGDTKVFKADSGNSNGRFWVWMVGPIEKSVFDTMPTEEPDPDNPGKMVFIATVPRRFYVNSYLMTFTSPDTIDKHIPDTPHNRPIFERFYREGVWLREIRR